MAEDSPAAASAVAAAAPSKKLHAGTAAPAVRRAQRGFRGASLLLRRGTPKSKKGRDRLAAPLRTYKTLSLQPVYFSPPEALLPHRAFDPHNALLPHRALLPQSALLPHKAFEPQRALLPHKAFDPHNAFVPVIAAEGEPLTNCDVPHTWPFDHACDVFQTAVELSFR